MVASIDSRQAKIGVAYGLAAFMWWGGAVFYFKAVAHVSAQEVLAHRIIWIALLLIALLGLQGRLRTAITSMKDKRYGRLQWTAIGLAAAGVAIVWIDNRQLPVVALALPLTFSLYGLIRKTTHVEVVVGLAAETACIAPAALLYLCYLEHVGESPSSFSVNRSAQPNS